MDPFTWFLIALGVLIVGVVAWQMVRKPSRGVDEVVVDRNRSEALGKGEYNGGAQHHGPNIGPTTGV